MNGEFMRAEELKISPFDHGFLYGAGFFETFRTYGGNVFLYDRTYGQVTYGTYRVPHYDAL